MMGLPSLDQKLRQLKLSRISAVYADWVRHAEEQQLGYAEFLDELVSEEVIGRQERQMQRRYKAAALLMRCQGAQEIDR